MTYLLDDFMQFFVSVSYFWGFLSDKFGRRPTLLASVFGVTGFCALFGFTNTNLGLPWAIFCRFMTGAFNGQSSS